MAFKEAISWLPPLSRGAQAPRRLACCIGMLARVSSLAPGAVCPPVLKTKWAGQSRAYSPPQAQPCLALQLFPQEGSWDGAAEAAGSRCCPWFGRNTIQECHLLGPGQVDMPVQGGKHVSPLCPVWVGMLVCWRLWGRLCEGRAGWFYTTWLSLEWEIAKELVWGKHAF